MQKYGNVRFATVACAKCMRYGGRGGGTIPWGGGGGNTGHGTIYEFSWQKELAKYQILPDVHSLTVSSFQHGNGFEFDPSITPMLEKKTCDCQLSTCTEHAQVGIFGHPGLGTGSSSY